MVHTDNVFICVYNVMIHLLGIAGLVVHTDNVFICGYAALVFMYV